MRAIVRYVSSIQNTGDNEQEFKDALKSLIQDVDWWPERPQDDPEVVARKEEVLNAIAQPDVNRDYVYTIHDALPGTNSWGIVAMQTEGAGSPYRVTFRVRGDSVAVLQEASVQLVERVQKHNRTNPQSMTLSINRDTPNIEIRPRGPGRAILLGELRNQCC